MVPKYSICIVSKDRIDYCFTSNKSLAKDGAWKVKKSKNRYSDSFLVLPDPSKKFNQSQFEKIQEFSELQKPMQKPIEVSQQGCKIELLTFRVNSTNGEFKSYILQKAIFNLKNLMFCLIQFTKPSQLNWQSN